jgi:hypothetical protein
MPLTFPQNPQVGDEYTFNNRTYTFNGTTWNVPSVSLKTSSTEPVNPLDGDIWLDSEDGEFAVYVGGGWLSIAGSRGSIGYTGSIGFTGSVGLAVDVSSTEVQSPSDGRLWLNSSTGELKIYYSSAWKNVVFDGNSSISDAKGNIRSVPINSQTAAYTLVGSDAGKCVSTSSGNVTVPASVFSAGDSVSIFNASAGDITIVSGAGVTMNLVGDPSTGNRTLAAKGLATVFCVAVDTFVCTGGGVI